ncbi:MAG: hypothetical protein J6Q65_00175, partial [Lentisphaeria bacterium]|nr:hypothetical protein [Lentisphaeria bacterium]
MVGDAVVTLSGLTVYNNTFTADKAVLGFGGGTLQANVFNNTIVGNEGVTVSFSFAANGGKLNLLNNIFMNTNGTRSVAISKGTVTAFGNVYADGATVSTGVALNGPKLASAATDLGIHNTLAAVDEVFGTDDLSTVWDGRTLAVSKDGAAADSGVLVGKIGNVFYVMKDGKWYAADQSVYADFDLTAAGYGLGSSATVYATAANTVTDGETKVPADRLYSLNNGGVEMIQSGAYALHEVSTEESLPVIVIPGYVGTTTYGGESLSLVEMKKPVTVNGVELFLDITWKAVDGFATDGTQNAGTYTNTLTVESVKVYDTLGEDVTAQYEISPFINSTVTIGKKAVTVVIHREGKNVGDADPELLYTVTGLVGNDTLSGALEREAGEDAGTYRINHGTLGANDSNYTIEYVDTDAWFTIRPEGTEVPVIKVEAFSGTNTYGTALYLVEEQKEMILEIGDQQVWLYLDVTWGVADGIATDGTQDAGTYEGVLSVKNVVVYGLDDQGMLADMTDQYEFDKTVLSDLVIGKKTISVTAANVGKNVGETDPELTYTVSGLVGDDTLNGTLSRAEGETVGTYDITLGTLAEANPNYSIDFTGGTFTIRAEGTVTTMIVVEGYSNTNTYGSTLDLVEEKKAVTVTVGEEEVTLYLDVTWNLAEGIAADGTQNAGTYENALTVKSVTVYNELGEDVTAAYDLDMTAKSDLVIGQKTLTVTAHDKNITFGTMEPELTYTVDGLVNGDTLTGALVRETGTDVGTYKISKGSLASSGNYIMHFTDATLTINQKVLTVDPAMITANITGKTYDGTTDVTAATLSINGVALSYTSAAYNSANVDEVSYITFNGLTVTDTNYALSADSVIIGALGKITAKNLTITVDTVTADITAKTYDGTTDMADTTLTVKDGETDVALTWTSGAFDNANVANVGFATFKGLSAGSNYKLSANTVTVLAAGKIMAKELTVDADTITANITAKTYDGTTDVADATLAIDGVSVNWTSAAFNSANVAEANSVTFNGLMVDSTNYVLSADTVTIAATDKLTAKEITINTDTVTASISSKIYDGTADVKDATLTVKIGEENVALNWTSAAFDSANVDEVS